MDEAAIVLVTGVSRSTSAIEVNIDGLVQALQVSMLQFLVEKGSLKV